MHFTAEFKLFFLTIFLKLLYSELECMGLNTELIARKFFFNKIVSVKSVTVLCFLNDSISTAVPILRLRNTSFTHEFFLQLQI